MRRDDMDELPEMRRAKPAAREVGAGQAKRAQILAGAGRVFLAHGFAAASMGEIARAAGVSKGTLYVYFESKKALFHSLIEEQKRNTAERLAEFDPSDRDVAAVLTSFATRLIRELTDPAHVALMRVVIGASEVFPEIGRTFYESGPAFGARRLAAYLAALNKEGVLTIDDPDAAAWRFLGMCNTPLLTAAIMGLPRPGATKIARQADGVVHAFMKASTPA